MLKNRPKSLSELLQQPDSVIRRLADEAVRRVTLAEHMRHELPADLASGVLGCNVREDGTLVVVAASPEWASRLRFESDRLLRICRGREPDVHRVKLRVANSDQY